MTYTNTKLNSPQITQPTPNAQKNAKNINDTNDAKEGENDNNFTENEKVKRTNNIPPIDVWTSTQDATQQIIRYRLPRFSCNFSKINKSKMRIFPKTNEIRNRLIDLLNESKINFNTYTPADEKM